MAITPGRRIGNFEVVRPIGEGGFGEVYEAVNPLLNRRVAIKVLHGRLMEDPELVRRFLNEARAASGIHHPNIVEVFDAGMTPEREPYIVMEYLAGDSLQRLIADRGRLPLPTVMEIARQACSALAAAHAADIVHRDLKPENLFVLRGSAVLPELQVKVLDFGIAKVKPAGGGQPTVKTRAGLVMGSPAYMSPEQCKDSSDVDHRTDIYSMGVIVYEMLAGAPPFAAASAADLLVMQLSAAPPALRLRVPDVPEHVEQAVMRALAKDRAARYARIDELVAALLDGPVAPEGPAKVAGGAPALGASGLSLAAGTAVLANGVPANPPSRPITTFALASGESAVSASPEPARRAWRVPLAAGAALVLLVGLGVVLLKRRSPTVAERPAIGAVPAHPRAGDPVPPATVRLRVQSSPAGAAVLDGSATVLGRTPFEQLFPQGEGTTRLTVRLAGYDDATVTLGLDADSQTVVSLRPAGTPGRRVGAAVQPTDKTRPRPRPRTVPSADHEWIAH